jgi:hypothetical protein
MLFAPNADALSPVASALFPTAVDPSPETVLDPVPQANSCFAAFSTHPAAAAGAVTVCAAPSTGNSVIAPAAQLVINATRRIAGIIMTTPIPAVCPQRCFSRLQEPMPERKDCRSSDNMSVTRAPHFTAKYMKLWSLRVGPAVFQMIYTGPRGRRVDATQEPSHSRSAASARREKSLPRRRPRANAPLWLVAVP